MSARGLLLPCFLLAGFGAASAWPDRGTAPRRDGVVTFYANDETQSTFDFATGSYGGQIIDGELVLDQTQIAFDLFEANQLSFGYVRGVVAEVIDLGYSYIEPVEHADDRSPKPDLSLYFSLQLVDGHFFYRAPIRREFRDSDAQRIFQPLPRDGLQSFEPQVGHTYVMRFKTRGAKDEESVVVKFYIIDIQPDHTLTMRWERMF